MCVRACVCVCEYSGYQKYIIHLNCEPDWLNKLFKVSVSHISFNMLLDMVLEIKCIIKETNAVFILPALH